MCAAESRESTGGGTGVAKTSGEIRSTVGHFLALAFSILPSTLRFGIVFGRKLRRAGLIYLPCRAFSLAMPCRFVPCLDVLVRRLALLQLKRYLVGNLGRVRACVGGKTSEGQAVTRRQWEGGVETTMTGLGPAG